jgi:hypothetical protein
MQAQSDSIPAWSEHCGDHWRRHVLEHAGFDICDVVGPSPRRAGDWAAMMNRLGVRTMAGVVSAVHGQPIPCRQARRGDILRQGWALGICRGERGEFFGGMLVPMGQVHQAWSLAVPQALLYVGPYLAG